MTKLARVLGWTLSAVVLFLGSMYSASQGSGEIAVFHSCDSAGA